VISGRCCAWTTVHKASRTIMTATRIIGRGF
jgi:hypothetical protein